ncbi:MAG: hypothetical protein MUE92_08955 [Chloroflexi bacterium]|jgi:hypothetical protein|nr:hypothetical protein [Chloroflexota bacterium]
MTDERFLRGFRAFDVAVAPDAAFAERLFGDLASELGFEPGGAAAAPSLGTRLRRSLRLDWRPFPPATMRLVYLAATLALLLAALAATAFVGSQLRSHPSPLDIVRQSQAVVANPPPFVLVYRSPASSADLRFSYDGAGTWRSDDPDGSYGLWDGTRQGYYNAQSRTWGVVDVPVTQPPFHLLMDMWGWVSVNVADALGMPTKVECADATWVGNATVGGRDAYHIRCPSWDTDYWIDHESSLVLKFLPGLDTPGWIDATPAGTLRGVEAVSLDLLPPTAAAFSWDGPVGAYPEDQPPASTVLAVGAPAPSWTGSTVDGEEVVLPVPGKPAAVFFTATWCPEGWGATYDALAGIAATNPGLAVTVVMNDNRGTAVGYRSLHPTSHPMVADEVGLFAEAWGITGFPTLTLLDGEGAVAAIVQGEVAPETMDGLLRALDAGEPLPSIVPAVTPVPETTPGPTPAPHAAMPAWSGTLLGGGTLDSATLRGKPTVVYFAVGLQGKGDSPIDGNLVAFGRAAPTLQSRANLVMIVSAEWTPGSFAALLDQLGIDVPTVLDWDGAVTSAMSDGLQMPQGLSTFVFDADGRMVTTGANFPGEQFVLEALDAAASGTLLPLPTEAP